MIKLIFILFVYLTLWLAPAISFGEELNLKFPIVHKSIVRINKHCTGFIVKKSIVLTASHCLINSTKNNNLQLVVFYNQKIKYFKILYSSFNINMKNDYAILMGNTADLPALKLTAEKPRKEDESIAHIGYSDGPTQFVTYGVYIKNDNNIDKMALHTIPGDSGGPIMRHSDKKVFALCIGSFWPINAPYTYGVSMKNVIKTLEELKVY